MNRDQVVESKRKSDMLKLLPIIMKWSGSGLSDRILSGYSRVQIQNSTLCQVELDSDINLSDYS